MLLGVLAITLTLVPGLNISKTTDPIFLCFFAVKILLLLREADIIFVQVLQETVESNHGAQDRN